MYRFFAQMALISAQNHLGPRACGLATHCHTISVAVHSINDGGVRCTTGLDVRLSCPMTNP